MSSSEIGCSILGVLLLVFTHSIPKLFVTRHVPRNASTDNMNGEGREQMPPPAAGFLIKGSFFTVGASNLCLPSCPGGRLVDGVPPA